MPKATIATAKQKRANSSNKMLRKQPILLLLFAVHFGHNLKAQCGLDAISHSVIVEVKHSAKKFVHFSTSIDSESWFSGLWLNNNIASVQDNGL